MGADGKRSGNPPVATRPPLHFCAICESIPAAIFLFRQRPGGPRRFLAFTALIETFTGYTPAQLLENNQLLWKSIDADDHAAIEQAAVRAIEHGGYSDIECRMHPRPGETLWVNVAMRPERLPDGAVLCYGTASYARERKQLEDSLREQASRFDNTARNIPGAVFRYRRHADGRDAVEYMSDGCFRLWEVPAEAVVNDATVLWAAIVPEDLPAMQASVENSARSMTPWRHSWRIVTPSGHRKWLEAAGQPERSDDGSIFWDTVIIDVTDRALAELHSEELASQLAHEAIHDALTGLPNRNQLDGQLRSALTRARRHHEEFFAVVCIDINRFKLINDSLGPAVGDEVLRRIAGVLRTTLRAGDLAARIGADEFVLLLEELSNLDELMHTVSRVEQALRTITEIDGRAVSISATMGIALSDPRYREPLELLRDADLALHRAKRDTRNFYALFDETMHRQAVRRLRIERELREAIDRGMLVVHYQPIVAVRTGRTVAVEALARWEHAELGTITPGEFIPIAEESALIEDLDRYVLRTAIGDLADWRRRLGDQAPRYVSVNFSARDLVRDDGAQFLVSSVEQAGCVPECLQLEITESMLIADYDQAQQTLHGLSDLGFRVSLDDFGTGYSSLTYLHQLPVHSIKADRSFVADAQDNTVSRGILESLSLLAGSLELPIIAEGVETPEQLALVRELGYPLVQGFLYSAARPREALEDWLLGEH